MRTIRRIVILVAVTVTLTVLPLSGKAQTQPEVGRLAAQTTKKAAATYAHRILTTSLAGCLVVERLCAELDAALHVELEKAIPNTQFIDREEAVKHLGDHGFLSIDAYLGALDAVASDAGAEVVIAEGFQRKDKDCELYTIITDAKHLYSLADFDVRTSCLAVPTELSSSLLKDPTGAFLIVPAVVPAVQGIRAPSCVQCPKPKYSGDAPRGMIRGLVEILITVTAQGTVEDARVVGAVEHGMALASLRTVNGWRLKPAVGVDGVPFPARVMVAVRFTLGPDTNTLRTVRPR